MQGSRRPFEPGERFGHLTVIDEGPARRTPAGKARRTIEVLCDCGRSVLKTPDVLVSGRVKTCGREHHKLAVGQTFGRLTLLAPAEPYIRPGSGKAKSRWLAQCSCGKKTVVRSDLLKSLNTRSCGNHMMKPRVALSKYKNGGSATPGEVWELLTVLGDGEPFITASGKALDTWLLRCVCGTEITRVAWFVKTHRVHSCGCSPRD